MERTLSPLSPDDIRALRGDRSRAAFAALVGVTPLTVYRWELPADAPELRRPRGKVLARLRAFAAALPGSPPSSLSPHSPSPSAAPIDVEERAALVPALHLIDEARVAEAERELVRLLASTALRGATARALAAVALAKVQLLARHDTSAAMSSLVSVGFDGGHHTPEVQLELHLVAALLFAHPDGQLFDVGKANHHAALAEALMPHGRAEHRFFLAYVRLNAAVAAYDGALLARAMEVFSGGGAAATTPLHQALALEAAALTTLTLTNPADAAAKAEALHAGVDGSELVLQRVRALIWRAEVQVEQGGPPRGIFELVTEAERLLQRNRVAPGVHAMLLQRNKGDALVRLGRLAEAEAALLEAAAIGRAIAYTPIRIVTSLARLHVYAGAPAALRGLADACASSNDAQRDVTRVVGVVLATLADAHEGRAAAGWPASLHEQLGELRRLGVWVNAYRYLALDVASLVVARGSVDEAERALALADRALELSSSPSAAAVHRRNKAVLALRQGRLLDARQALDAARATFEAVGDVPEALLARHGLAHVDALAAASDAARAEAEARRATVERELVALGLAVPARAKVDVPAEPTRRAAPVSALSSAQLVVPVQRLAARGVSAAILQRELVDVVADLFPARSVRLDEIASDGTATTLGARAAPGSASDAGGAIEFRDGVGRTLRLSVGGAHDDATRAALQIVATTSALAFEVAGLRGFSQRREARPADDDPLPDFVAASPSTRRLKAELARLSGSRATIIVTGESGTGKEVVARAVHDLSRRAKAPYVTFNSAAVPRDLFEGQLFGYRKGAFTGAVADHPGVIRAADGGTLFLDEIGELPLEVQPKLLRFLENGEILPLGERKPVHVDVRVIAATHRDLLQLVRDGRFREDLYYRLQVVPVRIAPLRERREDVVALARSFVQRLTPAGASPPLFTPDAEAKLMAHTWPGNVRELRNVIERSLAFDPMPRVMSADDIRL